MGKNLNPELERVLVATDNLGWKKWGPYLTERQWGTVREDYSENGSAWEYISHDKARSNAYRWGEEGIGGISDHKQLICLALGLWNENDPILKERLFGVSGNEGNHGEDVKELYYYLDSSPTHSYMKMLYKYPFKYPYKDIVDETRRRTKKDAEYEIIDTAAFHEDRYFDVYIEVAKAGIDDILIEYTIINRSNEDQNIHILPTLWFRNRWSYDSDIEKPLMTQVNDSSCEINCEEYGDFRFYAENPDGALYCDNETNLKRVYGVENKEGNYFKDGINDYIVDSNKEAVNPNQAGTKMSYHFNRNVKAKETVKVKVRFAKGEKSNPFVDFDDIVSFRKSETDTYYAHLQETIKDEEHSKIQRQAFAGMLWSKQFYYFDVYQWINGDGKGVAPNKNRKKGRNKDWTHLYNENIISMPDKWEYPWYAAWDLAFHTVTLAYLDPYFAKRQLHLLLREYYMHPNGQIPAYEWNFSDVNPPVHAWACWKVFEIDRDTHGKPDLKFLEGVFQKLVMNFTWWVNQKDVSGKNVFDGGFLGLDNIGVFDRSNLPEGVDHIEQADATSWMAMYALNMLRISLELSIHNRAYEESASKFLQHFLLIVEAMSRLGDDKVDLWDREDKFFYDKIYLKDGTSKLLKTRSLVGVIPLFAAEIITRECYVYLHHFRRRIMGMRKNRPDLENLINHIIEEGEAQTHLLTLNYEGRLEGILNRLLDEDEFMSEYGIRSMSKYHEKNPFEFNFKGQTHSVKYVPGESDSGMFGGNSNWRGPIWFPINYLIVESLYKYHEFYGEGKKFECPTGSGNFLTLKEIGLEIAGRLVSIFTKNNEGNKAFYGANEKLQKDEHFKDHYLFYEFFHGDSGKGLGAAHQTGWTGLVANLIFDLHKKDVSETDKA